MRESLYIYIFFSIMVYHKILNIGPCCLSILYSQSIPPPPSSLPTSYINLDNPVSNRPLCPLQSLETNLFDSHWYNVHINFTFLETIPPTHTCFFWKAPTSEQEPRVWVPIMSAMTLIHWETTDNCFSSLGHFFNNSAIIPGKEAELRNMSGHDLPHYHFNQALPKTSWVFQVPGLFYVLRHWVGLNWFLVKYSSSRHCGARWLLP